MFISFAFFVLSFEILDRSSLAAPNTHNTTSHKIMPHYA
jgi:hypothetical protein